MSSSAKATSLSDDPRKPLFKIEPTLWEKLFWWGPLKRLSRVFRQGLLMLRIGLIEPFFVLRLGEGYREALARRLGKFSDEGYANSIWLHGRATGEVRLLAPVVRKLAGRTRMVVTASLLKDVRLARETFGDVATVLHIPLELGFAVRRLLDHYGVRGLVLAEGTDLFPIELLRLAGRDLPVRVINGNCSPLTFDLQRSILPHYFAVEHFGVTSEDERQNYLGLGIPPERLTITGDLKRSDGSAEKSSLAGQVRAFCAERPLLIAASTHEPEEEIVLDAFDRAGGGERALLLWAPRDQDRFEAVSERLEAGPWEFLRRSELPDPSSHSQSSSKAEEGVEPKHPDILFLDSFGELRELFPGALGAFIGNTLNQGGVGHNPWEAMAVGVPVVAGPGLDGIMRRSGVEEGAGWLRVTDGEGLADVWKQWLTAPESAQALGAEALAQAQIDDGGLKATLGILQPLFAPLVPVEPPAAERSSPQAPS